MAHTTVNGTTTADAVEYAGADALPSIKQDAILRDSERLVKRYGPAPDPVTDDYTSAASDAELRVFDYLANTEGLYSSSSISGISENFVDFDKVRAIVVSTLKDYADTSSSNTAYIEKMGR